MRTGNPARSRTAPARPRGVARERVPRPAGPARRELSPLLVQDLAQRRAGARGSSGEGPRGWHLRALQLLSARPKLVWRPHTPQHARPAGEPWIQGVGRHRCALRPFVAPCATTSVRLALRTSHLLARHLAAHPRNCGGGQRGVSRGDARSAVPASPRWSHTVPRKDAVHSGVGPLLVSKARPPASHAEACVGATPALAAQKAAAMHGGATLAALRRWSLWPPLSAARGPAQAAGSARGARGPPGGARVREPRHADARGRFCFWRGSRFSSFVRMLSICVTRRTKGIRALGGQLRRDR